MKVSDKCVLDLFREVVGKKAGFRCEKCGAFGQDFHPHHIFTRANKSIRYDAALNGAWLCNSCHREAEASPRDFNAIMVALRGNSWWVELVRAKNQVVKFNDAFRSEWKERLKNELRRAAA